MRIHLHKPGWQGYPEQEISIDADTIEFLDGGDVYTLEEIRTVMRNRRREHRRKLDEDKES